MPPMDKPPMSPDVQGQAPPPGIGQGMMQQQQEAKGGGLDTLVSTVEKMLLAVNDESFKPYAVKAIAQLKLGLGMSKQKQPQSGGMAGPPGPGGGPPPPGGGVPTPPTPGNMPG